MNRSVPVRASSVDITTPQVLGSQIQYMQSSLLDDLLAYDFFDGLGEIFTHTSFNEWRNHQLDLLLRGYRNGGVNGGRDLLTNDLLHHAGKYRQDTAIIRCGA